MLLKAIFPAAVFAVGVAPVLWHWRAWQDVQRDERDPQERDFRFRQFRRRMQASAMILLAAVAMLAGLFISPRRQPSLYVGVWFVVIVLVLWFVLLAIADMVSIRLRLSQLRREQRIGVARLESELKKARADLEQRRGDSNGRGNAKA